MKKNKPKEKLVKIVDKEFDDAIERSRVRVRVANQFHQYKRGDDLIVDDTHFTRALINNGTFVEVM